jgi:alpha-beta hydrolase superfamily lysophospholipase
MSEGTTTSPLSVVLVHGALADISSWTGVIERLQARGIQVTAAANPRRGNSIDSAYIASVFDHRSSPR